MKRRFSLEGKLAFVVTVTMAVAVGIAVRIAGHVDQFWLAWLLGVLAGVPVVLIILHHYMKPVRQLLLALADGLSSFRDADFTVSVGAERDDELGDLTRLYNSIGATLRNERLELNQRELLLDTVIQSTPVATVLVDARGRVLYSNTAARGMLAHGKKLEGLEFAKIIEQLPTPLREAAENNRDGLYTIDDANEQDTYHLSVRHFALNTQTHKLYLFKHLTREMNRREVATWKKVIRVISHELNNSLAPIASLAHSASTIAERGDTDQLQTVFATIGERADYLQAFIDGYASFARLPLPKPESIIWEDFVGSLRQTMQLQLDGDLPAQTGNFDPAQIQQVLINLLKNAHESGSPADEVRLSIVMRPDGARLVITDRGQGMSEEVLHSALLPFYSTKQSGTGLGLPLCREIVEAHGGRLSLANRDGGGLRVELWIPEQLSTEPVRASDSLS